MITLYHCNGARSTRSLWLLYELGLEFKLETLGFSMAALRTPEYLAISPLGRVPCLVDGDVTLFESGAICQYLCENYDSGTLYRAPGDAERVAWLQWLHYAETIAVHAACLVQQKVFIAPEQRSTVVQKLESRRLYKALEVIDNELATREYLLHGGFSAVDIAVGYGIVLGRGLADLSALERVESYRKRLAARAAFQRACPPDALAVVAD